MAALGSHDGTLGVGALYNFDRYPVRASAIPTVEAFHFQRMPTELLCNIFSFCTKRFLLESVSKTCKRFREVCVALYLEEMNVGQFFDFKMREKFSENLLAVRHIKVHAPGEKHEDEDTDCCHHMSPELMERSLGNLIDEITAGAFPVLKSFRMAYYDCQSELKVDSWDGRYGEAVVFPNLKILKVSQMSEEDRKYNPIARYLSRNFPGVEELWLDSAEVSGEPSMHSMRWKSRAWLNRFMKWSRMIKVKRVELKYVGHDDLPNDLIFASHQHFAVAIVEELIRVWTLYGMDALKTVHCARDEVSKDPNHNVDCTFEISRAAANVPTSIMEGRRNAATLHVKLVEKSF
ncbi:hypothetical protein TWF102_007126 [Orbilia oligospora]|uniref:F-box domain-containing protein n=1 Tax=Orbilia oligospora TaxID=2813651 RepID=A0A7C8JTC3_ORBOL|nr:hypothetical protein TWF102_007126 [Orbilia oligospora]KAF3117289.1 hypothetical protein TWF103_007431 [Orbilia oligospora]KAF3140329.1 hypothetical protein TWF703_003202 [Orbilia oligospora]